MAVLQDADRLTILADLMREVLGDMAVTKPQRTLLTTAQKARIAAAVLLKRYDKGA